jgi:hypothetical protein
VSARARYRPWFRNGLHEIQLAFFDEMVGQELHYLHSMEILSAPRPVVWQPEETRTPLLAIYDPASFRIKV